MRWLGSTAVGGLCSGGGALLLGALLVACGSSSESDPSSGPSGGPGAQGAGASTSASTATGAGGDDSSLAVGSSSVGSGGAGGSSGTGGAPSSGSGGIGGGLSDDVEVTCNSIGEGNTSITVNGVTRTFSTQLPDDTASPVAILFLWHGWLQNPGQFADEVVYDVAGGQWRPFDPNGFPMPLVVVTPTDTKMIPPWGLDWDIVDGSKDFPFFEGMLHCLDEQFTVDANRIYSFGFSAGAVFTNILSAKYPHLFAATMSESGAWFNDEAQWSDVLVPIVQWQWPDFAPADGGNVLLTHGGDEDFATVISLESANQKALPFLHDNGRSVLECQHGFGHTLDPDLTEAMYYQYMWSHQRGGPPLASLPAGFPTPANPIGSTGCTFHPAP